MDGFQPMFPTPHKLDNLHHSAKLLRSSPRILGSCSKGPRMHTDPGRARDCRSAEVTNLYTNLTCSHKAHEHHEIPLVGPTNIF